MKTTAASILAVLLMVLATIAGCGSGRRANPVVDAGRPGFDSGTPPLVDSGGGPRDTGMVTPRDAGVDAASGPRDSGTATPRDAGRMCARSCTTDSQCSSTCPSVPSSASCCDLATNSCYNAATLVCPAAGEDGGTGMMY